MIAPARGAVRVLRASALALTCLVLGLAGHVLAGGPTPSIAATLVLSAPLGCLCLVLTSRRCGTRSIGACMAGSQVVLHEAFMWLSAGQSCASPAMPAGMHLGHPGSPQLVLSCSPRGMTQMGHVGATHLTGLSPTMLGAHLLAGLLATSVLSHGERALWRLAAWVSRRVLVLGVRPHLAWRSVRSAFPQVLAVPPARVAAGPLSRRGPPLPV